ncbi:putative AbiEii toxin of type IV toxin-antitoxin system [Plasticicumulans lactativorans]|uniref:Putative AbiEii toxin of type IV toxin-antitoxin system n=1 Tax=Plasticicumulans lactativorans TaxID=1133106 RepID=A0A4R2LEH1_9GAMM|nr:ATP-binding protein [Plasticicumulans lactativorans]TCO82983.1 putative AbiEii toxin of type IV toxin-antitoxin system [Plasticicumulans lactativorans]
MLESIHLKNVGPAPEMKMDLAPRLNLITGDNGLGKSFLLDVAWWALTRTWAREMVIPKPGAKAEILYSYTKKTAGAYAFKSTYEPDKMRWTVKASRPPIPGVILYAQVDGGFSVWDPARNYWTQDAPDRPNAFLFTSEAVWKGNRYCKGLLDDWALWQAGNDQSFQVLKHVIETLSPSHSEKLVPGDLRKLTIDNPQRYPTLRMPYGEDVAIIHASAGMRRVIALAYLLTWAWQEHVESTRIRGDKPAREIVFLIDEIEGHLHPQWQRRIVPALLKVMDALTGEHGSKVQLIAATHSPLVLASLEPFFNANDDAWFDLDLEQRQAVLRKRPYVRHGEIGNWLVSEAFDLKEPRSLEGEQAIAAAQAILDAPAPSAKEIAQADQGLRKAGLPDIDPFWVRWGYFMEQHRAPSKRTSTGDKGKGGTKP